MNITKFTVSKFGADKAIKIIHSSSMAPYNLMVNLGSPYFVIFPIKSRLMFMRDNLGLTWSWMVNLGILGIFGIFGISHGSSEGYIPSKQLKLAALEASSASAWSAPRACWRMAGRALRRSWRSGIFLIHLFFGSVKTWDLMGLMWLMLFGL